MVNAVLRPPPINADLSVLADWMELVALKSGYASDSEILGLAQFDGEIENKYSDDEVVELLLDELFSELAYRCNASGRCYPFEINDNGTRLSRRSDDESKEGRTTYLYGLFASEYRRKLMIGTTAFPAEADKVDELLQICGTIAAAGLVAGPSFSFGFPRPDHTGFLVALKRVYEDLMKEGQPLASVAPGLSTRQKDKGIDVIAWRHFSDQMPGKLYLLGQCASGRDFLRKGVKSILSSLHNDWFIRSPASHPIDSLFIPFMLDESMPPNDQFSRHDNRVGFYLSQTRDVGVIVDRCRLAELVAAGVYFAENHAKSVQRLTDFSRVDEWVQHLIAAIATDG